MYPITTFYSINLFIPFVYEYTCRQIAQTNPANSRAVATAAIVVRLPRSTSLRNFRFSRISAFCATLTTSSGCPARLKDADITERDAPLLKTNRDEAIGRAGVAYILKTCAQNAAKAHPGSLPKKVTPHHLRHSKSVHMLENGINLVYIRDFLGHSSVVTTEMYAKASPELKRKALEKAGSKIVKKSRYSPKEKKNLLNWLKENI